MKQKLFKRDFSVLLCNIMRSIRMLYIRITRNINEVNNKTDDCCINKGNMSIKIT